MAADAQVTKNFKAKVFYRIPEVNGKAPGLGSLELEFKAKLERLPGYVRDLAQRGAGGMVGTTTYLFIPAHQITGIEVQETF